MTPEIIIGLSIVGLVLYIVWNDEGDPPKEEPKPWEAESELSATLRDRFTRF